MNAFWKGLGIQYEIFGGLIFGPGIFWGFDFYPHSVIPITWNPEYPLCFVHYYFEIRLIPYYIFSYVSW